MQKKTLLFWALALVVCFSLLVGCSPSSVTPSSTSPTPDIATASQNVVNISSFADLISVVEPSVVEINVSANVSIRRRTVLQQGAGSGWIMDANGTIITNNHVIAGATTITVTTSDGKTFPAR